MNHSMITSSVSMQALQKKLDSISNNISNVNTTGFKRREATFEDVLTNIKEQPQGFRQNGRLTPLGLTQSWGTKLSQTQLDLSQGSLNPTGNPLDIAMEGNGLFEVQTDKIGPDGQPLVGFTRDGALQFSNLVGGDPDRMYLTTTGGYLVRGTNDKPITIPKGYTIEITPKGDVIARNPQDLQQEPVNAGRIKLMRIIRPQLLSNDGNNLYSISEGVQPQDRNNILALYNPDAPDADAYRISVRQYHLEQSNVNLTDEITELMMVQRAYQLNARALSSSDTLMNLANNLRG